MIRYFNHFNSSTNTLTLFEFFVNYVNYDGSGQKDVSATDLEDWHVKTLEHIWTRERDYLNFIHIIFSNG